MKIHRAVVLARVFAVVFAVVCLACGPADVYAGAPASQPTTIASPTTAAALRKVVTAPNGFRIYHVGDLCILAEPADEPWIRTTIEAAPALARQSASTTSATTSAITSATTSATTAPATRPGSNIAERLRLRRNELVRQLTADLALAEPKLAADFVDHQLAPRLQRLADLKVPVIYMVTTEDRIKALLVDGWTEDRFSLNRATGHVSFNPTFELSTDRPMDDLLAPAVYDARMNPGERGEMLKAILTSTQGSIRNEVINRSASEFNAATVNFMLHNVFNPLKLKDDQLWLAQGVSSVLGAKYLAGLLDVNADELLAGMVAEPRGGMSIGAVDLLHPLPVEQLKPAFVPIYLDATRRKSAVVIYRLLKKAGDDSIPKILTALRAKPPADGPALVELIKSQTGQDLTELLRN